MTTFYAEGIRPKCGTPVAEYTAVLRSGIRPASAISGETPPMLVDEMEALIKNVNARLARVEQILPTLATKEDLRGLATRKDLREFATKRDLRGLATKDELRGLATKDELRAMIEEMRATKEDLRTEIRDSRRENSDRYTSLRADVELLAASLVEQMQLLAEVIKRER
jgi:hypothetical protein